MALNIEKRTRNELKRTRATSVAAWSDWAVTSDLPPYENTDLVEYKADVWGTWAATSDVPPYENTEWVQYRIVGRADITVDRLTSGSIIELADGEGYKWMGTGVFDTLMDAVNGNVKVEYDSGRIKGADYATVYLGALQSVLQQSVQFVLQEQLSEAQINTEGDKLLTSERNREVMETQKALYNRQRAGFDDNKYQKIFESQTNAWGITFQDTDTTFIPGAVGGAGGAAGDATFDQSLADIRRSYE